MAAEIVINKINITAEAVIDYRESLGLGSLDKFSLKAETESYIDFMNQSGRLLYDNYFRCRYQEPESGHMLMLFLYRVKKQSIMQNWDLKGICFAEDWSGDNEDEGKIRAWIETIIPPADKLSADWIAENDRALAYRVNRALKNTERTKLENVIAEVSDEFECKRDKEAAQKLVLLQGAHFRERRPSK